MLKLLNMPQPYLGKLSRNLSNSCPTLIVTSAPKEVLTKNWHQEMLNVETLNMPIPWKVLKKLWLNYSYHKIPTALEGLGYWSIWWEDCLYQKHNCQCVIHFIIYQYSIGDSTSLSTLYLLLPVNCAISVTLLWYLLGCGLPDQVCLTLHCPFLVQNVEMSPYFTVISSP
jgi:hypothetical protein